MPPMFWVWVGDGGGWQNLQVVMVRLWLWIAVFLLVHVRNQACCLDNITSSVMSFSDFTMDNDTSVKG